MDLVSNKPVSGNNSPYPGDKSKDLSVGLVPNVHIKQEPCNKFKDANRGDPTSEITTSKSANNDERTRTLSSERVKNVDERSNDKSDKFKNMEGSFDKQRNADTPSDKNRSSSSSVETPRTRI
jgi:hypothetical protein